MSREAVRQLYPTGRPFTRWWWFACDVRKEDVTSQLQWFEANGFGGVEIAWIYPPRGSDPWDRVFPGISQEEKRRRARAPVWLSREWSEIVAFTKAEADRMSLGCDFTFGTLWPFGDTNVPPAQASKAFNPEDARDRYQLQFIKWSWEQPAKGLVIDHLCRTAFKSYAERVGEALQHAMKGSPSALFCESWEVESKQLWTHGLDDTFKKRFGYDLTPHMKDLWAPEKSDIRYDYLTLISDLVIAEFYRPFAEYARHLRGFSRAQIAGAPVDPLEAYAVVDVPESEAMLYEPSFARIVSSAAALAQRPIVSSETFTCLYGFPEEKDPNKHKMAELVADLKLVVDALFANGVNQVFWHGAPFVPYGAARDFQFYATVHVGREGSLTQHLRPFNEYMRGVCVAMKQGRTYSDIAVWLPIDDGRMAGLYPEDQRVPGSQAAWELRYVYPPEDIRGHQPLWISAPFLRYAAVEDRTVTVGSLTFRALYVDVEFLSDEGLKIILRLAKEGLPVILKRRPKQPGVSKSSGYQDLLDELAVVAYPDVARAVTWPALVTPADEHRSPDWWARVDDNKLTIFFAHPIACGLKLPLEYGQSYTSVTLERKFVLSYAGTEHTLTLRFLPNQSRLVEVTPAGVTIVEDGYLPPPPR